MKRISRYLPLLLALFCCMQYASAQSGFDINIGFGGIHDKASPTQVDQALLPCSGPSDPYGPCVSTPALNGFMMGIGGDLMLWKKFGVGAQVAFQPAKQDYVDLNSSAAYQGLTGLQLQSRVTLYDFDGIYEPINTKKVAVKLKGGIGGANIKFYQTGTSLDALAGAQTFSQYYESSNHFNVLGSIGVQIYLTEHIFIRPEFDVHYVPNLNQFGSNVILQGMAWIGYSWGDRP